MLLVTITAQSLSALPGIQSHSVESLQPVRENLKQRLNPFGLFRFRRIFSKTMMPLQSRVKRRFIECSIAFKFLLIVVFCINGVFPLQDHVRYLQVPRRESVQW